MDYTRTIADYVFAALAGNPSLILFAAPSAFFYHPLVFIGLRLANHLWVIIFFFSKFVLGLTFLGPEMHRLEYFLAYPGYGLLLIDIMLWFHKHKYGRYPTRIEFDYPRQRSLKGTDVVFHYGMCIIPLLSFGGLLFILEDGLNLI